MVFHICGIDISVPVLDSQASKNIMFKLSAFSDAERLSNTLDCS